MLFCLYKITSVATGKSYIGQSRRPAHRLSAHLTNNPALFGFGHVWQILASASSKKNALAAETDLIAQHQTAWPNGYNRHAGVGVPRSSIPFNPAEGLLHAFETKAKISAKAMGHKRCVGRVFSDETKALMRQRKLDMYASGHNPLKGRKKSAEHVAAMSAAMTGKPAWNKGKPMHAASRAALDKANKGRSPHNKGKPWSAEVRAKISAAAKRRYATAAPTEPQP